MPPKKEKPEKTTVQECTSLVLQYLSQQNRPYSAIEVSANLHNKVTKPQATKILKELSESNQIASKASGKQVIYHALQDPKDSLTPQQLSELDQDIETLRNNVAELKNEETSAKSELIALKATLTLEALRDKSASLGDQKTELEARLVSLQNGSIQAVSAVEKSENDRSWKLWSYKVKARKKAFMELWTVLSENLPGDKTKDELWNELGFQSPEDT